MLQNPLKLLNHIAIPVDAENEIHDFYREILGFIEKYRFEIDVETSNHIFRINRPIKVAVVEKDELRLELYLAMNNDLRINHICLNVTDFHEICRKADSGGYDVTADWKTFR